MLAWPGLAWITVETTMITIADFKESNYNTNINDRYILNAQDQFMKLAWVHGDSSIPYDIEKENYPLWIIIAPNTVVQCDLMNSDIDSGEEGWY